MLVPMMLSSRYVGIYGIDGCSLVSGGFGISKIDAWLDNIADRALHHLETIFLCRVSIVSESIV